MHTLIVDADKRRLLQDTGWCVSPVNRRSQRLHARATLNAPGIRKGQSLHRLVMRVAKDRRVRALDGNLLNATSANLQSCTRSDVAILNRRGEPNKLVGVTHHVPPKWLRTQKHWSASIKVDGVKVHLGYFKSANEAGCAFDRAARYLYGRNAVTNQSLGLISAKVAATKTCRTAGRLARDRVRQFQEKATIERLPALLSTKPTCASFAAFTKKPTEQPVEVTCFHTGRVRPAADPKQEKKERRAARKARKLARQIVMQRRRERAAAAMAELDAEGSG
jgi:hypothetical protein